MKRLNGFSRFMSEVTRRSQILSSHAVSRMFQYIALAVFILGLSFEPTAQAIPGTQVDCATSLVATNSSAFVLVPGIGVAIDNGNASRTCVVQFSSDAASDADIGTVGQIAVRYSVDGGACAAFGPEYFFTGNNILETSTNISVITLGPGAHIIEPCFRVNFGGGSAILGRRCMVVECRTK